jgi:hypothetical protein
MAILTADHESLPGRAALECLGMEPKHQPTQSRSNEWGGQCWWWEERKAHCVRLWNHLIDTDSGDQGADLS